MLIQELGGLLNHPRKIDKATVLNETLYYFRNYNGNAFSFKKEKTYNQQLKSILFLFFF